MNVVRLAVLAFLGSVLSGCADSPCGTKPGEILDEALCVGRGPETLKGADEDYFADMDYGVSHDPDLIATRLASYVPGVSPADAKAAFVRGRNNWIVWTAGNDTLWDELSRASLGNLDFLKTLSSHPSMSYGRSSRWEYLGLVNEPCFAQATGPREDRYGLWLDVRDPACAADPFENEQKYPGVAIGARGRNLPVGSYYGYATGVVGLRLFPNPDFDEAAEKRWDPERYYNDPEYYQDKDLVKPYRVGMSCGFCHVGPNPTRPPDGIENGNPQWAWENLNSNPGAQYFWVDRIFMWRSDSSNFAHHLFHTSRPGALDTSFVSTDYINNPRTMNAIYNLPARLGLALKFGKETLVGGEQLNAQFNDLPSVPPDSPLRQLFEPQDTVLSPRVLKDGADSVGALGALNRVFVNIGLFSEEWLQHFRPLIGGQDITPFEIAVARKNSAYWLANEAQTPDLALFFLASATPDRLADAPGGDQYLTESTETLERGKEVFAERCARCHSSKLPERVVELFPDRGCVNDGYLQCFDSYWQWTKTDEFRSEMTAIVKADDFLANNFLSSELRIPVTLTETNACSPLARNALAGNIWDNFSSSTYKGLPSVGEIEVQQPFSGEVRTFEMPAGGRGYTRPASLVSLWTSAPFLLNNSVGRFEASASVGDRMASFEDAIVQMLWPERREGDFAVMTKSGRTHPGVIDRTSEDTYLRVDRGFLPDFLGPLLGWFERWLPWLFGSGGVEIGPIPAGTPVNLISNIDMTRRADVLKILKEAKRDLKEIEGNDDPEARRAAFADLVDPLIDVSTCPDYVVNRGHYFGTSYIGDEPGLSDSDKEALIGFLKTF